MRYLVFCFIILTILFSSCKVSNNNSADVKHVIVYQEEGRFAGWPANYGIWSWGDEIVVGFSLAYFKVRDGHHAIDPDKPSVNRFARSLDGGQTWTLQVPNYLDENGNAREPVDCPGGIDFTAPGFAMMVRSSTFFVTNDRCKTWQGPYKLPDFGRKAILARTDYIVNEEHDLHAFMAAAKDDGKEGWPFCVRTRDGAKTWEFLSWIGPQPDDGGYAIMPSTVRTSNDGFLTMIRRKGMQGKDRSFWIEAYSSQDNGKSWQFLNKPTETLAGNPGHMIRLKDGRLLLIYGYRQAPFGIRAKLSKNEGLSWGEEIVLRDDGGNWDLGYPRVVQRNDGKIVVVYYFNKDENKERYIAATILDPDN